MKTIKSVYKIGHGPSSSHTVGPFRAAQIFGERWPGADEYRVTLYGSLAFTGEGHGTEKAVRSGLPGIKVVFDREAKDLPHPNTMLFEAFKNGELWGRDRMFSVGGGSVRIENEESDDEAEVYPQKNFSDILKICRDRSLNLAQFIYRLEDPSLRDYLKTVWEAMKASVKRGLAAEGILPGGLGVARKAKTLYETRCYNESADVTMNRIIAAYAYAVSEENADENIVVTAPTCGSCGVLPAVMYYMHSERG
ncbi:MAG: L-serine ammonia-lyase, iron-sulfur-dependent, subunit alpha, partial [Clostridia bacterium]|nr:L-serine ammonia-lyase, iron-sulfur-dependent, subunit alpha [Clostridia bacterium]